MNLKRTGSPRRHEGEARLAPTEAVQEGGSVGGTWVPPAIYTACWIARLVSTRARCFLYSGEARRSPLGFRPSDAASAACSGVAPWASARSTLEQRTGVGPTLVRPTRQ